MRELSQEVRERTGRDERGDRKIKVSEEEQLVVGKFIMSFDGLHLTVTLPRQVSLIWDGVSSAYIKLSNKNTPKLYQNIEFPYKL